MDASPTKKRRSVAASCLGRLRQVALSILHEVCIVAHFVYPLRSEAGSALPLFALLMAAGLMLASLVIDQSSAEISLQSLQRSADAAALAASRRLNGRVDGWWDAKKAAVGSLRANSITRIPNEYAERLTLTSGDTSFWDRAENLTRSVRETLPPNASMPYSNVGTEGASGPIHVTVERGLYWLDAARPHSYKFVSLEGDDDGLKGAVAYFLIANAVRVRVRVSELPTMFGSIFGRPTFQNFERESVAVMDSHLERPVAPIGIPLCELLLNTNPNVTKGNQLSGALDLSQQCERSSFVSETNARGDLQLALQGKTGLSAFFTYMSIQERRDGLTRSESFDRLPYFTGYKRSVPNICFDQFTGAAQNCKALPLYATLGVPSSVPGARATAAEVRSAMATRSPLAQVGSYFKPLDSIADLTEDGARAEIATAINRSERTFRQIFFDHTGGPKRNFPFLRTKHITPTASDPQSRPYVPGPQAAVYDRMISMPAPESFFADATVATFLMSDMAQAPASGQESGGQLNYSNPMCHDDNIPFNDPDNARVLEAYAMVIVPGTELNNAGDIVRYCDFENVFSGSPQAAVAPIAESVPTVIGFVKVNVFDLNFQKLSSREAGIIDPRNPAVKQTANTPVYLYGKGSLWDGNAESLTLAGEAGAISQIHQYEEEYETNLTCNTNSSAQKNQCGDTPKFPFGPVSLPSEWLECFELAPIVALWNELASIASTQPASETVLRAIQDLETALTNPIPQRPDQHCLPRLKDGLYDRNVASSYQPLHNLKPGVGCGGLRVRLDCGSQRTVITTGEDWSQSSPMIVSSQL